jgi:putative sigma-54 modulation protein
MIRNDARRRNRVRRTHVRIDVVGRNVEVTEEFRELVRKRFERVARQVAEPAELDVVLREETNPAIKASQVAEATLHMKGATLHAEESAEKMTTAIREMSDDLKRQVKRHRELRRKRSVTRKLVGQMRRGGVPEA